MLKFLQQFVSLLFVLVSSSTNNNKVCVHAQGLNTTDMTTFAQLLDSIGRSLLPGDIGETILAPTNTAFDAFRNDDEDRWIKYTTQSSSSSSNNNNNEPSSTYFFIHLRDLLEWHLITEGRYTFEDIFNGRREFLENLHGNITIDQQFQRLDNVPAEQFVETNIGAAGGGAIIHATDQVVVPPYLANNNLILQLLEDRNPKFELSTFANLALHVGLDEEINEIYEHGVTVLVPPNRRFNRAEIDVELLKTPEMRNYTRDLLLCHIIMDNYHEAGIFAFNEENDQEEFLVTSFLGTSLWITTTEDRLRFQSTDVIIPDQASYGGIFHVIDYPLTPPKASDFAFWTPLSTSWDTRDCFKFFRQTLLTSEDISQMFDTSITLWCPTDEAFAFFSNQDYERMLEPIWIRHATEFILNHMSAPALNRSELVAMSPGYITMLNGATYELRKSGTFPRIKNGIEQGRSEFGDLIAVDGYMHILDSAITPTAVSRSIYAQTSSHPDFSLLAENIDLVDLTNIVDRDLPLTLLAPDNNAFQRITFDSTDGDEVIQRHLIRGLLFLDVIANATQLTAINGVTLDVELRGESNEFVYVGGAYLYEADILARNGVLHYVDRVIGEPYDTSSPTVSPAPTNTASPTAYIPPTTAPVPTTGAVPIFLPPGLEPTLATPYDTLSPTKSPAPTITASPTAYNPPTPPFLPTINFPPDTSAPTESAAPTITPSHTTPSPTESSAPTITPSHATSSPSESSMPTITPSQATLSPTASISPTITPAQNTSSPPKSAAPTITPSQDTSSTASVMVSSIWTMAVASVGLVAMLCETIT